MESVSDQSNESFFKLLIKCPIDRLDEIIHHLVDLFCNQKIAVYEQFSNIWSMIEWWDLVQESRKFFSSFENENDEISILSNLSEEFKCVIRECLEVRKLDIKSSLLTKTHAISSCYLTDFDWKLKLTLASDKMAQINEPRLFLDLDLSGNDEKSLHLDLSKEELKTLIDSMEKAKKALGDITIPD